jgi:hypothetical protein
MSADPLRDDLGIELERLIAIEPSPQLAARVRQRVAAERIATSATWRWQLVGVATVAALVTVAVVALRIEPATAPVPVVPPSNAPAISIPVLPLDVALRLVLPPRSHRTVRNEREAAARFPILAMPPLEPPTEISIEPVAIEPLSAIAPLSGERQ